MLDSFWSRHPRAAGVVGTAFGLILLAVASGGWFIDDSLGARGLQAEAVVEKVVRLNDPQYRVRFTLPDGRVVRTETSFASGEAKPGDRIWVEYDPEDPQTAAEVGSRDGAWLLYGSFGVAGLGLVGHHVWKLCRPRETD